MKTYFCPKCGKKGKGIGKKNLCEECWKEENEVAEIPEKIEIDVCPQCGFIKINNQWKEFESEKEIVIKALNKYIGDCEAEAEIESTERGMDVSLICKKEFKGEKITQKFETEIKKNKKSCPECSKRFSGFFKYVIQLRGNKVEEMLSKIENRSNELQDRKNYVSKIEKEKDGYNIYLSSRKITENILKVLKNNYSLETKRSRELIGEEEGEKIYRSFVSVKTED